MDTLSAEDTLRLNVLLANNPQAIRIDEDRLCVFGLMGEREHRIQLNPTTRQERYLKWVREMISGHLQRSPGGYPVFLKRWTRMGMLRDESLAQMLLLGEPEAVVAAVSSQGLTDELARRAWWCVQNDENARLMLAVPAVVAGKMGPLLAEYLFEHLPFEPESERIIETVRLILQPGLLSADKQKALWMRAQKKSAYLTGFLHAGPEAIPPHQPHAAMDQYKDELNRLVALHNPYSVLLLKLLAPTGQGYLRVVQQVLAKPADQESLLSLLAALRALLAPISVQGAGVMRQREQIELSAQALQLVHAIPDLEPMARCLDVLADLGYPALRPYLGDSDASGSLMRRKLAPFLAYLQDCLVILTGL